ncbi:ATP-binding protein [Aeromicrobium sp. Leaf350]|uniref:ATP-binding protein n=1 Tax=Aeromicrobium sp. Leaf350 TaxID=2876565 RepID=UPI001E34A0FB|nr:ATP-binding protein [Aeromicrobium sp. Leaf350]
MSDTEVTQLPFASTSLRAARHQLLTFLAEHDVPKPTADDVLLVLGEMAANAVRHGAPRHDGTFEARWSLAHGSISLSVEDGGQGGHLEPTQAADTATSGRGLAIIDRLAERWWIERDGGTRVCAVLPLRTV